MNTNMRNSFNSLVVPLLLAAVAAWIVSTALAGGNLPLVSGARGAMLALLVVGMAMCTAGIGQVGKSGRWTGPLAILGYLLGAAILVVGIGTLLGVRLPLVAGETQALVLVAGLMAVKLVIGIAGTLFRLL